MKKIRTIIVDDEPDCVSLLKFELTHHCPQVEIIATFTSSTNALEEINMLKPDLVFLDIEMPKLNGFQLLLELMPISFNVVFVTAYNQFALKAFRFNALDYLLKPFDVSDLIEAVHKADKANNPTNQQIESVYKDVKGASISKIALPNAHGVSFIEVNEIEFAEASNNYTKLHLINKQQHLLTKTLKDVQDVLEDMHFLRIHRQYIVNLNHIKEFYKGENMYVVMNNGENIPVARSQKDNLIQKYGWL